MLTKMVYSYYMSIAIMADKYKILYQSLYNLSTIACCLHTRMDRQKKKPNILKKI